MGKFDLAINLQKQAAAFVKAGRKTSVLETAPTIFHGINPTLTYAPSGKTFMLPRFMSQEMKTARNMNKIAISQCKTPISSDFPKALPSDLRRLTDTSFEASSLRAAYTNPKTGDVCHLLHEGRTPEGLVKIRVIDKDGAYVKTVEVKPKKVVIFDDFSHGTNIGGAYSSQFPQLSHGDNVKLMAQRTNPFADYEFIDIAKDKNRNAYLNLYDELALLQKRIDKGEEISMISLSLGRGAKNDFMKQQIGLINATEKQVKTTDILNNNDVFEKFPLADFASKNKGKVRIIESAGNWGKNSVNADLHYPEIEGVGALTPFGKTAGLSASRNSLHTQHYEQGVFPYTPTAQGLSLFGGKTTDIPLRPELRELAKNYLGKKPISTIPEENAKINRLKKSALEALDKESARVRSLVVSNDEALMLKDLYKKAMLEKRNNAGTAYKTQYEALHKQLGRRVQEKMKGYTSEYELAYKNAVEQLEREGKVMKTGFGEYYIPDSNPYTRLWKMEFKPDQSGNLVFASPHSDGQALMGTSFSTPVRTAKLALYDMLEGVLK